MAPLVRDRVAHLAATTRDQLTSLCLGEQRMPLDILIVESRFRIGLMLLVHGDPPLSDEACIIVRSRHRRSPLADRPGVDPRTATLTDREERTRGKTPAA